MTPTDKKDQRVSLHTVERLSVYRRKLEELSIDEVEYIHSRELAALVRVTPAQLRRDLASFGSYGNISRGYDVRRLSRTISEIIGTDRIQNVALVGVGDMGGALLTYRGFEERGFHIAAAFDIDPEKIGSVFAGRRCYGLDKLETVLVDLQVRVLILTARREGLQEVVDRAVRAGVNAFLNFVPTTLHVPAGCFMEEADISARLEKLSFLSRQDDGLLR